MTATPKEKENKYKLAFGYRGVSDESVSVSEVMIESYTLTERKSRLGVLLSPMFYEGKGNQITAIIITALAHAKDLNKHSDAEWLALIENRDTEDCLFDSFDNMGMGDVFTFCKAMEIYALNAKNGDKNGITLEEWAWLLPKDKKEAKFVAQLLCDGGINKYGLTCAGLTPGVLADNLWSYGFRDEDYDEEGNVIKERDIITGEELSNEGNVE